MHEKINVENDLNLALKSVNEIFNQYFYDYTSSRKKNLVISCNILIFRWRKFNYFWHFPKFMAKKWCLGRKVVENYK